jgi:hypothetical protein
MEAAMTIETRWRPCRQVLTGAPPGAPPAQAIEAEFAKQIGAESAVFAKQKCAQILKNSVYILFRADG